MLVASRDFLERVVSFVQATLPNGFDVDRRMQPFMRAS
jgi:hypothetical protein